MPWCWGSQPVPQACVWSHPCELPHIAGPTAILPGAGICGALYRLGQIPPEGPSGVATAQQDGAWVASLFVQVKDAPTL